MDYDGNEDESDNFSTLLMTLQNYFSIKIPSNRLTPNSELLSFFNIQSILNKEKKSVINLAKLLLCISSFSSNKGQNLKKVSSLDLSLVQLYYDSVYLFLIKNIEKKISTSYNNNILLGSIFDDDKKEEKKDDSKEIEKLKKIIEEKDSLINQYKTTELMKHDISVIQTDQDFLAGGDDMTMMNFNFDLDFDLKNNNQKVIYQIEKNTSFSFEKINIKQMFMDSLPTSQKNTNNSNNSSQCFSITKDTFNLSGGDSLHKKIEFLDETISKNRDMYERVINDYQLQIKSLKDKIDSLNYEHNMAFSEFRKNQEIEIQKIINDKNYSNSAELIRFRNEKNLEIENLRNIMNQRENMKNKEIEDMQNKLNEEKLRREKELELFNLDRVKVMNEYDKKINDLNIKIKDYEEKLQNAQNRLKSDPYYAREILSKTLFNFAPTIMKEN